MFKVRNKETLECYLKCNNENCSCISSTTNLHNSWISNNGELYLDLSTFDLKKVNLFISDKGNIKLFCNHTNKFINQYNSELELVK